MVLGFAGNATKGEGDRPRFGVLYLRWYQMPVRPMMPYYAW